MLVAAGLPMRQLGLVGRRSARARDAVRDLRALPARAADHVPGPVGRTPPARASRRCRARSRSAPAACSATASARRSRRSSTFPRPTPTSSSPSSARSSAVAGILGLLSLYGIIGYAGLRTAATPRASTPSSSPAGLTSLILCQALLNVYAVLGLAPLTGVPLPVHLLRLDVADRAARRDGPAAQRRGRRLGAPARRRRDAAERERPR